LTNQGDSQTKAIQWRGWGLFLGKSPSGRRFLPTARAGGSIPAFASRPPCSRRVESKYHRCGGSEVRIIAAASSVKTTTYELETMTYERPFDSEIRKRGPGKMMRTSESRHQQVSDCSGVWDL